MAQAKGRKRTTRKAPAKGRARKSTKHAYRPAWFKRMETRKRHAEAVMIFWLEFVTKCVIYGAATAVAVWVLATTFVF